MKKTVAVFCLFDIIELKVRLFQNNLILEKAQNIKF